MRRSGISILLLSFIFCLAGSSIFSEDQSAYRNSKLPIEQRVADLLSRMTLEEKVAQLTSGMEFKIMVGGNSVNTIETTLTVMSK